MKSLSGIYKRTVLLTALSILLVCTSCGSNNKTSSGGINSNNTNTSSTTSVSSNGKTTSSNVSNNNSSTNHYSVNEGYYSSIDNNASGVTLRKQLYNLMVSTHKTKYTYSALGKYLRQTDADPKNPNNVILFYTGESRPFNGSFSNTINREHVWPNSHGVGKTNGPAGDVHHIRPCDANVNSDRGNSYFGDGSSFYTPTDEFKGICARIILYVGMYYGPDNSSWNLNLKEATGDSSTTNDKNFGNLVDMLKWNMEFPVNDYEMRRNDIGQNLQGNRNPFIDHPEYACQVWGDTSEATRKVCHR